MLTLQPAQWRWANWRNLPPLPRPAPRPFSTTEQNEIVDKMRQQKSPLEMWWGRTLKDLPINLSRPEAHFWFAGLTSHLYERRQLAHLMKKSYDGSIGWDEIFKVSIGGSFPQMWSILLALLPLPKVFELVLRGGSYNLSTRKTDFMLGLYTYVLPYITDEEREQARAVLREHYTSELWLSNTNVPAQYYLMGMVGGFHAELEKYLASVNGTPYYQSSLVEVVLGLDDPDQVRKEMQRLKLQPAMPHHVYGWLAHTELRDLAWIVGGIRRRMGSRAGELLETLLQSVEDAALVPHLLSLQTIRRVAMLVNAWLNTHPELTAQGAVQTYFSQPKTQEFALAALGVLRRRGQEEFIQQALATLPASEQNTLTSMLNQLAPLHTEFTDATTPGWLVQGVRDIEFGKGKKQGALIPPRWVDYAELPPLVIEGNALTMQQGTALLTALRHSTLQNPHPFVTEICRHVSLYQRERFVLKLARVWQERGRSLKEKWAFYALALMGGDALVNDLVVWLQRWGQRSQDWRHVVLGVECLAQYATDYGRCKFLQFYATVENSYYYRSSIKEEFAEKMNQLARQYSLPIERLHEAFAPTCGINPQGQRLFDYGKRIFTLTLDDDFRYVLRDAQGKARPDLPKPAKLDDPLLAEQAIYEWRFFQKQLPEVVDYFVQGWQKAMHKKYSWSVAEFQQRILQHPIQRLLAQRVVWGIYSDQQLQQTFRITPEGDYADVADRPVMLPNNTQVGIPTYSDMEPQWQQVFDDYEIIAPFRQQ